MDPGTFKQRGNVNQVHVTRFPTQAAIVETREKEITPTNNRQLVTRKLAVLFQGCIRMFEDFEAWRYLIIREETSYLQEVKELSRPLVASLGAAGRFLYPIGSMGRKVYLPT